MGRGEPIGLPRPRSLARPARQTLRRLGAAAKAGASVCYFDGAGAGLEAVEELVEAGALLLALAAFL